MVAANERDGQYLSLQLRIDTSTFQLYLPAGSIMDITRLAKFTADAKTAASKLGDNAKAFGIKAGQVAADKAEAASMNISDGMRTAKSALDGAAVVVADGTRKGVDAAKVAAIATGNTLVTGADVAKRSASTIATAAFDQNGDGTFDQEDLKILTRKLVATGMDAAKEIAQSDLVKKAAAGAVVGGAIASVVPGIGTAVGAVIGAGGATYKHFTDK